jgi:hypothetical protein
MMEKSNLVDRVYGATLSIAYIFILYFVGDLFIRWLGVADLGILDVIVTYLGFSLLFFFLGVIVAPIMIFLTVKRKNESMGWAFLFGYILFGAIAYFFLTNNY